MHEDAAVTLSGPLTHTSKLQIVRMRLYIPLPLQTRGTAGTSRNALTQCLPSFRVELPTSCEGMGEGGVPSQ